MDLKSFFTPELPLFNSRTKLLKKVLLFFYYYYCCLDDKVAFYPSFLIFFLLLFSPFFVNSSVATLPTLDLSPGDVVRDTGKDSGVQNVAFPFSHAEGVKYVNEGGGLRMKKKILHASSLQLCMVCFQITLQNK